VVATAEISDVTSRTAFPATTEVKVWRSPIVTEHNSDPPPVGSTFKFGEARHDWKSCGSVEHDVLSGPRKGYFIVTDHPWYNEPDVRIDTGQMTNSSKLALRAGSAPAQSPGASPPFKASWCTRAYSANGLQAMVEAHEGTTVQQYSHTWHQHSFLTDPSLGATSSSSRLEALVVGTSGNFSTDVRDYVMRIPEIIQYSNTGTHNEQSLQMCRPY
jgi:hypothetical protein